MLDIDASALSATALLEMCRASPLLTRLEVSGPAISSHLANNMDEFAITVSSACPLLEDVLLPTLNRRSKAESYQMHFPRTTTLCLGRSGGNFGHGNATATNTGLPTASILLVSSRRSRANPSK